MIFHRSPTPLLVACRGAVCSVLPYPANDYRPYLLRHPFLAFLNAFVLGGTVGAALLISLTPEIARLSTITSSSLTRRINEERFEAGLPPLRENPQLQRAARLKAEHMLGHDYFDHTSPDGVTPWAWFDLAHYPYRYAGENLAIDFTAAEEVVTAWMRSPGHRRNILSDQYDETAIAVLTGEFEGRTTTVVVQNFGRTETSFRARETRTAVATPARSIPATARETGVVSELIAPAIVTPEESVRVSSVTLRVGGTAPAESTVDIRLDGKVVRSFPAPDGTFDGVIPIAEDEERTATLTAVARVEERSSPLSRPRHIALDTKAPELTADQVLVLPDPQGVPGTVVLAVSAPGDALSVDFLQDDATSVRLQRAQGVLAARLATFPDGPFRLRLSDSSGNTRTTEVSPLFQYATSVPLQASPRIQFALVVNRTRPWLTSLLVALAGLLTVNLAAHLQKKRLFHLDLLAHAAVVLVLGTSVLFLT